MGCKASTVRHINKKKENEAEVKSATNEERIQEYELDISISRTEASEEATHVFLDEKTDTGSQNSQNRIMCREERRQSTLPDLSPEKNNSCYDSKQDYLSLSVDSISSVPQLFRIGPTKRAQQGDGTWEWWYKQIDDLRLTKDNASRARLQDIQNRLIRQYDVDKGRIELDLSWCYMERSAPYVIGRLLASPFLEEIRWVTTLRLDGNYFTDEGFGYMLAVLGEANEQTTVLPLLKHLYLNNMNLDHVSIHGILHYLFPVDMERTEREAIRRIIAGKSFSIPIEAYTPFENTLSTPLFPALEVLSLCDNCGIGNEGLALTLRCFISAHFKQREIQVLDLSRCAIDEVGVGYIHEYLEQLPDLLEKKEHIVVTKRIVLLGNRHSADQANNTSSLVYPDVIIGF